MSGRTLPRRRFLRLAGAASAASLLPTAIAAPALATAAAPPITPRSEWGGDLGPKGELPAERPEDVRFLLVHHTQTPNGYGPSQVARQLRSIYNFHTGSSKRWPDVAYNFFVDAYGRIWEGRTGSVERPVMGSATGGSQGFALLCCFLGDHSSSPPTDAAMEAMVALLAWLAATYSIDPTPGAVTEFTSRGSNRWPAGAHVTAATISGHREMSQTECPGDAAFRLVKDELPVRVAAALHGLPRTPAAQPAPAPPEPPAAPPPDTTAPDAPTPSTTVADGPPWSGFAAPSGRAAADGRSGARPTPGAGAWPNVLVGAGAAALAGAGAGALVRRHRAHRDWADDLAWESDLSGPAGPSPAGAVTFGWDAFDQAVRHDPCDR